MNTETKPENPPASPRPYSESQVRFASEPTPHCAQPGVTMRDYFAAAALTGRLANNESAYDPETVAENAFAYADAMLKRRSL